MTIPPRVCTVILNWNQPAMTLDCVRHLLATQSIVERDVIVIDNGSTPANLNILRNSLPSEIVFFSNARNLGFAGGMNVGMRYALHAGADYIWLLNNDAFPEKHCLAGLIHSLQADDSLAAVSPRLVFPDGSDQVVGAELNDYGSHLKMLCHYDMTSGNRVIVKGTAIVVRSTVLRAVGGFDQRFFAYREDDDLCMRVSSAGLGRFGVNGAFYCIHIDGATSGGAFSSFTAYLLARNGYLLAYNHLTPRRAVGAAIALTVEVFDWAIGLRNSHPATASALLAGSLAGLMHRFGRPPKGPFDAWWLRRLVFWKPWRLMPILRTCAARVATGYKVPPE